MKLDNISEEVYEQYRIGKNREKSETNNPCCEDTASFLKEYVYKISCKNREAEEFQQPTPPLIQPNNVEIVLNILKQKIKNLKFWIEELNININIESDLKEENAYYDKNILNEKFIK
ncbi:hypothetical protein CWI39_0889p0010 [Hamiltosporidium magnivora]|uniref:Uncharacterized protein n=1 Tax=Hamiltosporidium magnivora TaxID=148818 RepID=A0A4Q9L844_9MICR|nr:hypothetical protein CWI39_0889p0010 [Hamiltosporidium magnivora]